MRPSIVSVNETVSRQTFPAVRDSLRYLPGAAPQGAHARNQFVIIDWFYDVIIGSGVQRLHPAHEIALRRDHQHQRVILAFSYGAQNIPAIAIGQGQVEYDDVMVG